MELWLRVLIYALVLIAVYIFVKLTNFRIFGRRVVSLKWRLLIALLFPLILVLGLLFGAFIFGIVVIVLLILYLGSLFGRKRKFVIRF